MKNTTLDDFGSSNKGFSDVKTVFRIQQKNSTAMKRTRARKLLESEANKFQPPIQKNISLLIYPYSSIKYTIRERGGNVIFKICDIYLLATETEFRAICRNMFNHFKGKKRSPRDESSYREFIERPEILKRWKEIRLERGRGKLITSPEGKFHNLVKLSREVVKTYFPEGIMIPQLGWSIKRAKWRLGHYDPLYNTIVVSRALDARKVPRDVIRFVLYHELLHVKYYKQGKNKVNKTHSREFREDEQKFKNYKIIKNHLRNI